MGNGHETGMKHRLSDATGDHRINVTSEGGRGGSRVIVKIGSAVLAPGGTLDEARIAALASDIAGVRAMGIGVVVVTSGAVASGFKALGLTRPPKTIVQKQAAAAVGQQRLMAAWGSGFAEHNITIAQVLVTAEDLADRTRMVNVKRTLTHLLECNIIPVINENDSVSYAEIKLGDNDRLSALVANLLSPDLLVVLSSVEGVYAKGTQTVIPYFAGPAEASEHVNTDVSGVGTGGMITKVQAAMIAAEAGVPMVIAGGTLPGVIGRVVGGERLGTYFACSAAPSKRARQRWLGQSAKPAGTLHIDAGAATALTKKNASLLPSGILSVDGDFPARATVNVVYAGTPIARGVTSYAAHELRVIAGERSSRIGALLGYCYSEEAVHRDQLTLLIET
jgi:glutamate 5-kinase